MKRHEEGATHKNTDNNKDRHDDTRKNNRYRQQQATAGKYL
jgi:hypothetical protein